MIAGASATGSTSGLIRQPERAKKDDQGGRLFGIPLACQTVKKYFSKHDVGNIMAHLKNLE